MDGIRCIRFFPLFLSSFFSSPITRPSFGQILFLSSTPPPSLSKLSPKDMENSISLLSSVYGSVDSPDFPLPMPASEAGLCYNNQRRYLWTDAFGVLALTSLAELYQGEGKVDEANKYRRAVDTLIEVVHDSLGKPRSPKADDAMTEDKLSPTGCVGLRIGKVDTRRTTDAGMAYDGQYWHYLDKWLFALARAGRVEDGIHISKSIFPYFFDSGDGTGKGGGIRWKLSVDASAPSSFQRARASDDTLVALIVFSLLEGARALETPSLHNEIEMLKNALQGYSPRVTSDPLGWGLEAIYDQWLEGHPRLDSLASLQSVALHPKHISLPFRLYGALIGARILGEAVAPVQKVDRLVDLSLKHEIQAAAQGHEDHSSINRVMLAMCSLCPGALGRRHTDPLVVLEESGI